MYSRSNHIDNGKLAKRRVTKSLKITSQVNENTHPISDTAQHLIDGHQLMNNMKACPYMTATLVRGPSGSDLLRLGKTFKGRFLILPSARRMSLGHGDKFRNA